MNYQGIARYTPGKTQYVTQDEMSNYAMQVNRWGNEFLNNLNHQNVRRLYTDYCEVKSADGKTVLDGPTLTMYGDDDVHVRLFAGYASSTNNFVYALNSSDGDNEFYVSGGQAFFAGNVKTDKDAIVGNNLYIGSTDGLGKQIIMYNNGANYTIMGLNGAGNFSIGHYADMYLLANQSLNLQATSDLYLQSGGNLTVYSTNYIYLIADLNIDLSAAEIHMSSPVFIGADQVPTKSQVAADITWDSITRTLSLKSANSTTIKSVTISS
jgi:hypothetical protein